MSEIARSTSILSAVLLVLLGCSEPPSGGPAAFDEAEDVLATVNGAPVTEGDVAYWLRGSHGQTISAETRSNTLDRLVETELVYQRGRELGLHRDPTYQRSVRGLELSLRATQRSEMMKRFYNLEIAAKVEVDAEEARAYYEANARRIARSLHLGTLQFESREKALEGLQQLREGLSFEELADRIAAQAQPRYGWDLGSLRWSSIPVEWHDVVYALEPGEVSGVFEGKETGIAIFKLYAAAADPEADFELLEGAIADRLGNGDDPRAYYEANEARIRQTLHLGMIPFASQAKAQAALERLREGLSFDELAVALQSEAPHASRSSWDLGSMPWSRIPLEWHDVVYALEPGEVSEVFEGEQSGIRLFKLLGSTDDETVEFKSIRNGITNRLKDAKTRAAYRAYIAKLRADARIERVEPH